jgi:hypothetical protein
VTPDLSFTSRPGLNRRGGGSLALLYPVALMGVGMSVGFRGTPEPGELATAVLGAILFVIAAPTTWVFAIDFIEASRLTVVSVGALTSLPLWYLLGSRMASTTDHWILWLRRYLIFCGLWTVLMMVLMVVLAAIA